MALQESVSGCQAIERSEFTAQTFHTSNLYDASSYLLTALNAPDAVRRIFPALLGLLAGRSSVVRFYRRELATRLFGDPGGDKAELRRQESRTTYALSRMSEWIRDEGLGDLIAYHPGKKTIEGDLIPCRVRSRILRWVVDLAERADKDLTPDQPDSKRRAWFKREAQVIVKAKLRREKAITSSPGRREPRRADAYLRQSIGVLKSARNSASFCENEEELKCRFFDMLAAELGWVYPENSADSDSSTIGKFINKELIQGYENSDSLNDGEEEREHREEGDGGLGDEELEAFEGDTWADSTYLEILEPVKREVVEESGPVIPPPCVPSLPDPVEDHSRELASLVRGRSGAHWQALDAVLSTGAIPTQLLLGGNGDPGYTGEVGDVQEIYRLGVEVDDCGPRKKQRAMTWPSFLAGGFNRFIARSHDERLSIIVQFKIRSIFQIDDLTLEEAELLRDHSCLIVETSPGSFQAWVKIPAEQDNENGRRAYLARWKELGVKAGNRGSTHSGRWPGSINAKPTRNGWEVSIWWLSPGRRSSLEAIGATMPAKVPVTVQRATTGHFGATKGTSRDGFDAQAVWAEATRRKGSDRSTAHASFVKVAYHAGLSINEIVDYLIDYSTKAQANGREWTEKDVRRIVAKYAEGGAR